MKKLFFLLIAFSTLSLSAYLPLILRESAVVTGYFKDEVEHAGSIHNWLKKQPFFCHNNHEFMHLLAYEIIPHRERVIKEQKRSYIFKDTILSMGVTTTAAGLCIICGTFDIVTEHQMRDLAENIFYHQKTKIAKMISQYEKTLAYLEKLKILLIDHLKLA